MTLTAGVEVEIGLDTCVSTSICPIGFGGRDAVIIAKPPAKRPMLDAVGHRVKRVGTFRRILLWLTTSFLWPWTFEEMAVRRPLLSVSDLRKHGVSVHFADDKDENDYLVIQNHHVPLQLKNGIFILRAEIKSAETIASIPQMVENTWCLVEYACYPDSEPTSSFQRCGHQAKRLGVFNCDLTRR